uniref:Uncharacterized protein n=1 Tax=Anguilla anguilla TaxID=7936 RepID=A0A0E9X896_ANGAN
MECNILLRLRSRAGTAGNPTSFQNKLEKKQESVTKKKSQFTTSEKKMEKTPVY